MAIDKKWAANQIRHNRNTFIAAIGASYLFNTNAVLLLESQVVVCKDGCVIFNPEASDRSGKRYEIELGQLANEHQNNHPRYMETIKEFYKAFRRLLFKESFEIVKAYAEAHGHTPAFKAAPWHHFSRIVRNCVSHDFHFRFNKHDLTILPLSWGGVTIDSSMNGAHLREDQLPPDLVINLLNEWGQFITDH